MNKHLSLTGVGPFYVISISVVTLCSIYWKAKLESLWCLSQNMNGVTTGIGIVFIVIGVLLWVNAVFFSKIDKNIKENKLVTGGAFAYVRNPIYTGFMFLEWGILLVLRNGGIVIALPLYWILMTVFVKTTEEKWLRDLYGQEYLDYCERVNRCIPWFKTNKK